MTQAIGGPSYPGTPQQAIRWLPFRNDSSETVPPFGVVRITGATEHNGQIVLTVDKPKVDATIPIHLGWGVNGPAQVQSNYYGSLTMDPPYWVHYNDGDSPVAGQAWGPYGSFSITKYLAAQDFTILGNSLGSGSAARVLCWWTPGLRAYGGFDASSFTITTTPTDLDFSSSTNAFNVHGVLPWFDTGDYLITKQAGAYRLLLTGTITRASGSSAQDVTFGINGSVGGAAMPSKVFSIPASSALPVTIAMHGIVAAATNEEFRVVALTSADTCTFNGEFSMVRGG